MVNALEDVAYTAAEARVVPPVQLRRHYNRFISPPRQFCLPQAVNLSMCDLSMCDDDEVECLSEWRCISTRCCLTLGPLTDPARGEHCAHDAKCNYAALRALVGSVGRSKVCRA